MLTTLSRTAALATMIAGMTAAATAQTTTADPHHPGTMLTQAMPPSGMMGPSRMSQSTAGSAAARSAGRVPSGPSARPTITRVDSANSRTVLRAWRVRSSVRHSLTNTATASDSQLESGIDSGKLD